ncbi:MAG: hypothetical protein ACM3QW_04630 [Ignavibacteriales bacterium]
MMKTNANGDECTKPFRLKVRFDYKGKSKTSRFPFKSPSVEQVAEQIREQKVSMLRNVPIQGIQIQDIDLSSDIYTVYDDISGNSIGYAPVVINFHADSIEDAVLFIMKEEFRKVEVIEPDQVTLNKIEIERVMFRVNEELKAYKAFLEKKLEYWK